LLIETKERIDRMLERIPPLHHFPSLYQLAFAVVIGARGKKRRRGEVYPQKKTLPKKLLTHSPTYKNAEKQRMYSTSSLPCNSLPVRERAAPLLNARCFPEMEHKMWRAPKRAMLMCGE
jgi:hypothetical protein